MHNWPAMQPNTVGLISGATMATADRVTIRFISKGGHGAPYQTVDPELVAAHIIAVAQGIVLRNTRPIDVAVLSLCAIRASDRDAMRVGPGEVTLVGTVHTFDAGGQLPKERRLAERCSAVTQGSAAGAEVRFDRIYLRHTQQPRPSPLCRRCRRTPRRFRAAGARHEADHRGRRLFLHAAGRAGCVPAHRPGGGRLMTVICIASRHDFNDGILLLGRRCMPAWSSRAYR